MTCGRDRRSLTADEFSGFDWDDGNWPKCGKHGVSRAEIESVFRGGPAVEGDPSHSADEARSRAIGRAESGRFVFVVFTLRRGETKTMIRPISARYMHRKEIRHYGGG